MELLGIEDQVSIQIDGFDPVFPIANEDLPRSNDKKMSSVHFLRFEFSETIINAAKAGGSWNIHSGYLNYQHETGTLAAEVSQSLIRDFD